MREQLVELLETLGFPVFRQGSLNSVNDYPESFFTYWNFTNDDEGFYSGAPAHAVWGFWVYFYSTDPETTETMSERARRLLRGSGYIVRGKPEDVKVDAPMHTGMMFTAYYMETYEKENTDE